MPSIAIGVRPVLGPDDGYTPLIAAPLAHGPQLVSTIARSTPLTCPSPLMSLEQPDCAWAIIVQNVGDDPPQTFEVFARDFGAVDEGIAASNHLLGALRIRAGANVGLVDNHNNATGKGQEAIYTNELFVPAGVALVTNGYRIYTRTATIPGTVSDPADGIVVEAAPPCPADLFPNGIVDAADLSALLISWGPCSGSGIADIDGDGNVGASDLSLLLVSWGPCAN